MAVPSATSKRIYLCDGATLVFPYPFFIFENKDLNVVLFKISDGTMTTLTLDTDYSVSDAGEEAGGNVTILLDPAGPSMFIVAPTSDYKLIITREIAMTQSLDYVEGGNFPATSHERGLDRLMMICQQLEEKINRAFIRDPSQTSGMIVSDLTASWYILRDIDLSANVAADLSDITSTGANIEDAVTKKHASGSDTSLGVQTADVNMNSHKFTNLSAPVANNDSARKIDADEAPKVAATLIVAANDTIDKTRADYVCDAVADDVQIQAAIDALDTAGVGGKIILLEGTYNIEATITIAAGDEDLILQGCGWGTILKAKVNLNDEVISCTADRVTIRDMYVENSTNAQATIQDCVEFSSADDCIIEKVKIRGRMDTYDCPLHIKDCDRIKVLYCHIILSTGGVTDHQGILTIDGGSLHGIIKGNTIDGTATTVDGTVGICGYTTVSGYKRCIISNNIIIGDGANLDYGIKTVNHADYSENAIVGNIIYNCHIDGINISGANCSENLVDGNMARDGVADSGTNTVVGANNAA